MLRFRLTSAAVAVLLCGPVLAQTTPPPIPALPAPALDDTAPPQAFIQAAMQALAAGRTGEAQEAIERAESRALTRSVKPSQASQPSGQSLVQQLGQARQALASGDRMQAITLLGVAAKNPEAVVK